MRDKELETFFIKPPPDSTTIKVAPQLLNSFPNQNSKRIDYVIVYEKLGEIKKNDLKNQNKLLVRSAFFAKLKAEKFDIYEIEHKKKSEIKGDKTTVFCLLSASTDRLLDEAELVKLQMVLKNVT